MNKIKTTAQDYLGNSVAGCVISEPISFTPLQSKSLQECAKEAGFTHVFTIKEPIAAALSFEYSLNQKILIVDFGGNNFNVSLVEIKDGIFSILESQEDLTLGGSCLDKVLVDLNMAEFKRKTRLDLTENRRSLLKLKYACEQTKRALSQLEVAPCSIESLMDGIDHHFNVNRGRFEIASEHLYQRCADLVVSTIEKCKLTPNQIDSVLLVGGSSKVPRFQAVISNLFRDCPNTSIKIDSDPDECIARGCLDQARVITQHGINHFVAAMSDKKQLVVAHTVKDIGIADSNGNVCVVIPRNTPLPVLRQVQLETIKANQKDIFLVVTEGEDAVVEKKLVEIVFPTEGIVEVSFSIEKDLVLNVSLKDSKSGKTVSVKVDA